MFQDEIRLAAALALGYVWNPSILLERKLLFVKCFIWLAVCEATVGAMGTLLKVVIDNVQQAVFGYILARVACERDVTADGCN